MLLLFSSLTQGIEIIELTRPAPSEAQSSAQQEDEPQWSKHHSGGSCGDAKYWEALGEASRNLVLPRSGSPERFRSSRSLGREAASSALGKSTERRGCRDRCSEPRTMWALTLTCMLVVLIVLIVVLLLSIYL